jgi:hypothetical protein
MRVVWCQSRPSSLRQTNRSCDRSGRYCKPAAASARRSRPPQPHEEVEYRDTGSPGRTAAPGRRPRGRQPTWTAACPGTFRDPRTGGGRLIPDHLAENLELPEQGSWQQTLKWLENLRLHQDQAAGRKAADQGHAVARRNLDQLTKPGSWRKLYGG